MRTRWTALLALALLSSSPAIAAGPAVPAGPGGRVDGVDTLVGFCRAFGDGQTPKPRKNATRVAPDDTMLCLGYMLAMQGLVVLADEHGRRIFGACPPEDTTVADLTRTFLTWAEKHRSTARETAAIAVLKSFQDAYPCRSAELTSGAAEANARR